MYKCYICEKDILAEESKFMLAIEVPYLNIFVHKFCYLETDITKELLEKMVKEYLLLIKNKK